MSSDLPLDANLRLVQENDSDPSGVRRNRKRRAESAWRLIVHDECRPAWNMAVDQAIFEAMEEGMCPPTFRLYRWSEPAVTVGRFQDVERTVKLDACRLFGVDVFRRPTGGRGILHGSDQTMSIAVPMTWFGSDALSVLDTYRLLSVGFLHAYSLLDVPLRAGECKRGRPTGGDCFAVSSGADLVDSSGVKLLGSAQRRGKRGLLQQSSLLHRTASSPAPGDVFSGDTTPSTYPLHKLTVNELTRHLIDGFVEGLGLTLEEGTLTMWELERSAAIMNSREKFIDY